MKDMKELLEAAHSDVALMHQQMRESPQYDDWDTAQAALTAHWAVENAVVAGEKLREAIRTATDALDSVIDNADGAVLHAAGGAQEALSCIWNFADPLAEVPA